MPSKDHAAGAAPQSLKTFWPMFVNRYFFTTGGAPNRPDLP
jgi:hypothetical protein